MPCSHTKWQTTWHLLPARSVQTQGWASHPDKVCSLPKGHKSLQRSLIPLWSRSLWTSEPVEECFSVYPGYGSKLQGGHPVVVSLRSRPSVMLRTESMVNTYWQVQGLVHWKNFASTNGNEKEKHLLNSKMRSMYPNMRTRKSPKMVQARSRVCCPFCNAFSSSSKDSTDFPSGPAGCCSGRLVSCPPSARLLKKYTFLKKLQSEIRVPHLIFHAWNLEVVTWRQKKMCCLMLAHA